MSDREEKKNKTVAMFTSIGIHAALLIAFLLTMAWRAPNPPLPEYGIELNFGLDQQGSGDIQPDKPVGAEENVDQVKEEAEPEKTEVVEKVEEKVSEPVTNKLESPVVVKEEKKEPVKEKKIEPVKETKPAKEEVKQDTKVTEQKSTTGEVKQSQGDDASKQGDKGNPEGKLDAKALYGKQGGGGGGNGFDLSMSGWAWANTPKIPDLPDNEDGRIVFEIECDEDGEIVGITTTERGLSPKAEQLLKEEIRSNSLIRTSGGKVPERSKGKVIFLLKAK